MSDLAELQLLHDDWIRKHCYCIVGGSTNVRYMTRTDCSAF